MKIASLLLAQLISTSSMASTNINGLLELSPKNRVGVNSGWFHVDESSVDFHMSYNGFDLKNHKRIRNREIIHKALSMIDQARSQIVMNVFLFDNMFSKTIPELDVVTEITNKLIQKKKNNPKINITIILDPLHRAYSRRTSDSVSKFLENGIDVFYSDLLPMKATSKLGFPEGIGHIGRIIDEISLGLFGTIINSTAAAINLPVGKLDGHQIDLEVAFGASLLKANHRKILVTDIDGTDEFETLVSSENPHNGSDDSTNTSLSVKGDLAKFVYSVLREDAAHSMLKQTSIPLTTGMPKYAQLSSASKEEYNLPKYSPKKLDAYFAEVLPAIDIASLNKGQGSQETRAKFVSEIEVKKEAIRLLENAKADDIVRIQMFYLSEPEIVNTIAKVSARSDRKNNPIQILLDPSKDAFNKIKDGTPNRQVAHYLLNEFKNSNINLRWYATHGEQNHAKVMSITNKETSKFEIFTGSTNWTGKNMNNINMEANLSVAGNERIVEKFNANFDKLFNNEDPFVLYSWDYSAYDLKTTRNLNSGHEVVSKWSDEKVSTWISDHKEEIIAIYSNKYRAQFNSLSNDDFLNWANEKISKDKSETMRAVRYIVGSAVNKDSNEKKFSKWKKKYLKKWISGEKLGFVSW